jgi:branched-chain amino acid transport system ATP-binding protein
VISVLRGVTLEVPRGAVVALLGANGAGKTTLLRAVSGLLGMHGGRVRAGTIELDGASLLGTDAARIVRLGVSQVMEGRRIFAELSVEDNLRAGAFTRRDRAEVRRSLERVMRLFPALAERRASVAGYLSGGEQQMLAIARALMARPRLLLLDEPSTGLAPRLVDSIADIVAGVNGEGTTVVLAEQNAAMALSVASRAYVLERGRVVAEGPPSRFSAGDVLRASYLGTGSPP